MLDEEVKAHPACPIRQHANGQHSEAMVNQMPHRQRGTFLRREFQSSSCSLSASLAPSCLSPYQKWLCILRVRPQNPTSTPTPSRMRYPGCPPLTSIPLQSSPSPAMSPQLSNPWLPWLTGRTKQLRDTYQAEWHRLVPFPSREEVPVSGS
ncbi:hypothetical protein BKA56DRAFT_565728 [Ilyonectria sp. MPI-CAGE-AT-0026]|nr:hypothetical protein BKA56DRAFT_565728 [Ilyonectria sp. MPI-CAGE-AT-0026]